MKFQFQSKATDICNVLPSQSDSGNSPQSFHVYRYKKTFLFQSLCNALKFALNNLLNDFKPMLPDLCGLVISIIRSKFVPPVEIAQKCIILFYKDAECQSIMKQCFMEVVSYNISVFDVSDMCHMFYCFYILSIYQSNFLC